MSIQIPILIWLPALVWAITYVLTKYHGVRNFIKECFDFDL
jgi:hypothetical protein